MTFKIKGNPKDGTSEIQMPGGFGVKYNEKKGSYKFYGPDGPLVDVQMYGDGRYDVDISDGHHAADDKRLAEPIKERRARRSVQAAGDDAQSNKLMRYLKRPRKMSQIIEHMGFDSVYKAKQALEAVGVKAEGKTRGTRYSLK
jgi:hypothetical protein